MLRFKNSCNVKEWLVIRLKRDGWFARPHPGLLPPGEGSTFYVFLIVVSASSYPTVGTCQNTDKLVMGLPALTLPSPPGEGSSFYVF
jgi:hypothetical protein